MNDLLEKHCLPCEGGVQPLNKSEAQNKLLQIPGWSLNPAANELSRAFEFKNFYRTMSFVNAVAHIANQENHHPDLEVGYNYCRIRYSTHAIQGLSENDFICAAKINELLK
jgi:4a-hydroxytetrahydrobiopterin dehydratase